MSSVVLLVAASSRAMVESAIRSGYACRSVDYFGDLDHESLAPNLAPRPGLGVPRSAAGLTRLAGLVPADSVAYGGALENHPEVVARLAAGRELLGNGPDALRRVRDAAELADVLRGAGVAVPRQLGSGEARSEASNGRWLRRRRRSAGGLGIRWWWPGDGIGVDELVQEYVEGTPASAVVVADGRRAVVLGLTRQLIGDEAFGALGFRYCGNVVPLTDDEDEFRAVLAQVERAAEAVTLAFGLRGLFGIDFVSRDGSVRVLEVNPRYTASVELVERARGLPIFELHVRGCRGRLPDDMEAPRAGRGRACGKAILFARRTLALGDTRPWLGRGIRDVPRPGSRITAGSPICTVFATAATPDACEGALRAVAARHESSLVRPSTRADDEVHTA